ncbi:hypothetical protein GWK47_029191 [Chionoecetes opilio]|uniref:Uncharacterized protein n=1 Tax=Chionoecetes opilio TaxID=41210 RepID=A0A8J4YKK1_CHIOP|nr:hypothetical protein GWK47_029191 [Chionoecetes opilio]
MEGGGGDEALKDAVGLEADSGLDHILSLLSLLHKDALDAVCLLLITHFKNAQYPKDNINKCVKGQMTLYEFLCHVCQKFKNVKEGRHSKKSKSKRTSSSSSCSNHHQETVGDATQGLEDLQSNRPSDIPNLLDKERILGKLTIDNLMEKDEDACQVLYELDLNFVLNVVLNRHINFNLNEKLIEALNSLKKVRRTLVHAEYRFSESDFDDNLNRLELILKELHLPDQVLRERMDVCRDEAKSGNKGQKIFDELRREAHPHYSAPQTSFVPPNITCSRMLPKDDKKDAKVVIEDLLKFIEAQHLDPIVLCGEQKEEKDGVMGRLAFRAAGKSSPRYKLVLCLKESHRRSSCHQGTSVRDTQKAAQGFQDQIFACLANLVPDTVHKYGLDAVKRIVKTYQRDILFLINWNVSVLGPVQSEMQRGTWVVTCDGQQPPQGGWQVLRLEPYTKDQVENMLHHFDNSKDLLRCYHNFDSKDILSSMDMIQIFCEVCETICTVTDFEVVEKYVLRTLQRPLPLPKRVLNHTEAFLRTLWHVPDKKIKKAKYADKKTGSGDKALYPRKRNEVLEDQNKHKHPFDNWSFLLELDEACVGKVEVLKRIVSILSDIPCWYFNVSDCLDKKKLTRLEKVLKKVTLDQKDPLIIKLKSNSNNVTLLTELWKKLRGNKGLYDCVDIMVTVEESDATHLSNRSELADFLKAVADTQVPLYITRYQGPMFSHTSSFLKCICMRQLSILDVSVYDVKSLCEVMACGALPSLTKVFIKVDLELTEQTHLKPGSMEFPPKISVHITFRYFPEIQQLLNSFKCCHRLYSLSIHGLYVFNGFKLNLSEFSHLKSFNINCKPELSEDSSQVVEEEGMEVEVGVKEGRTEPECGTNRLPRHHWAWPLLFGLSLPQNLERLLLRNADFLNDSNQRLLLSDTRLSLTGVGKILCSQTEAEEDVNHKGAKRPKRN